MPINWTNLFKKYKSSWLALKDDETTVVGKGKTAKKAMENAITRGYTNPILVHMPARLVSYVG